MSSSTWIGSLDINSWVQKILNQEASQLKNIEQAQVSQLVKTQNTLNAELSTYGTVQGYLNNFKQDLTNLAKAFTPNFQVNYSDSSVANASIVGTVVPGTHTLAVTQLAQAERISSTSNYASTSTAANLTESLSISIGDEQAPSAQFSVNVTPTDTLQAICNNINSGAVAHSAGVTASIVSTGINQYKLVISSNQTGEANAVNISENVTGMASLGMTNQLTTAQDAKFSLDNLSYTQPTNSNVILGLNITLLKSGTPSSPLTTTINLNPTNQLTDVSNAIKQVITDYNQIDSYIEKTQTSNALPDSTLSLLLSSLQNLMNQSFGGTNSTYSKLADIGININNKAAPIPITYANGQSGTCYPTGQLEIDTDTLNAALNNNFSSVEALLNDEQYGLFNKVTDALTEGRGLIWKTLNDPSQGGIALVNSQLKTITTKIENADDAVDNQINNLIYKYGKLDLLLSNLQGQSQYISQQISIWNNKG